MSIGHNLGIDLDDTLIQTDQYGSWSFKPEIFDNLIILRDRGYLFYIITAREDILINRTQLTQICKLLRIKGINIISVTYTNHNMKGTYARRLKCAYLIDDNHLFLSDCIKFGVIPIHLLEDSNAPSQFGYIRVDSWNQIVDILP
jgi:acid phosphatase class B